MKLFNFKFDIQFKSQIIKKSKMKYKKIEYLIVIYFLFYIFIALNFNFILLINMLN